MAANNSTEFPGNFTHAEELGWQPAPLTRGTASILWSCASVIFLITWTNFHSSVGTAWKQRIYTAITTTLIPQTSAFVAVRDEKFALRLYHVLTDYADLPVWKKGWTMQKSFVVVQHGIRAGQYIKRHPSIHSAHSMVVELDENIDTNTNGRHSSGPRPVQSADIEPGEIINPETFLLLVLIGRIRYEDFPSAEEIDEKSNADWFSKGAALVQLAWFVLNLVCRGFSAACDISMLEFLITDWIMFGLIAAASWWLSPQNIKTPFYVPVQDCLMAAGATSSDRGLDLRIGALLDHLTGYRNYQPGGRAPPETRLGPARLHHRRGYRSYENEDQRRPYRTKSILSFPVFLALCFIVIIQLLLHTGVCYFYQWHSRIPAKLWYIFTAFTMLSETGILFVESQVGSDWGVASIYETYIRPLRHGPPQIGKEHESVSKCLAMARGMGIYDADDLERRRRASEWKCHIAWLRVAAATSLVLLLCHFGKLVIALTAFNSAPDRIYKVPHVGILEAIGHVGG